MTSLRISIAQVPSEPLNLSINTQKAIHAIHDASSAESDLVLFPELFLCGYDLQAIRNDPEKFAVSLDSQYILEIQQACKQKQIAAIFGVCLMNDSELFNSAIMINKEGKIGCTYHKMHLFAGEKAIFVSGWRQELLHLEQFTIGIGICYDGGFPEFSRSLTKKGAELIVFPSAFADGDARRRYHLYFPMRALENTVFIATANTIGEAGSLSFFGESMIVDPYGQSILETGSSPGLFSATIEKSMIHKAREKLTYLADLKPDYESQ